MSQSPIQNKCRHCKHYAHKQGENAGYCYGNPPSAQLMGTPNGVQPVSVEVIVTSDRPACRHFVEASRIVTLN